MSEIAIRVENLSKYYHMYDRPQDRLKHAILPRLQRLAGRAPTEYARTFWALRNVSFEVARGESVGIIGRNGSGKSTLLQMICGTLTPASGSVQVNGRIAALLELGSGFNPEFSGRDNVYMNASVLGLSKDEVDARYDAIAAFAGIGEFIDQPVKTYSSGMVVRLAFAVSVSVDPDILVVDEALAVGDMAFQQQCLQRLSDLRAAGTTILLVTHDIMLTRNYCHRVVYLDHGEVKGIGDAEAMGEMYLKDIFAPTVTAEASPAPARPDAGKVRFGNEGGAIIASSLSSEDHSGVVFKAGDTAIVQVTARVEAVVQSPEIVVQLRDARGYVLYGISTRPADLTVAPDGSGREISATLELPLPLGPGDYSLSLGLVNRLGESVAPVLDKIVAALTFSIAPGPLSRTHGPVDLGARWRAGRSGEKGSPA